MKLRSLIEDVIKHSSGHDPEEIRRDINRHKAAFLYLCVFDAGPVAAYQRLRICLERGENPKDVYFNGLRSDLLSQLFGEVGGSFTFPPPSPNSRLPRWFRSEVQAYIKSPLSNPSGDLSYWLMSRLLQDGRFGDALNLVRKRWKISGEPLEWYERMNSEQEKLFAYCRSLRINLVSTGNDYPKANPVTPWDWPFWTPGSTFLIADEPSKNACGIGFQDPGGVRFLGCRDFRDASTYRAPIDVLGVGFPIHDYDRDLGALAWLAGGDPESSEWRIWVEIILWNFQDPPSFGWNPPNAQHWEGLGRNLIFGKVCHVEGSDYAWRPQGRIRGHPKLVDVTAKSYLPGIRLLSRWIRLSDFAEDLEPQLVYAIVQEWGDYEEPPDRANMRRAVMALARPTSKDEAWREAEKLSNNTDLADLGKLDRTLVNSAQRRRARQSKRSVTPHQRPFAKGRP